MAAVRKQLGAIFHHGAAVALVLLMAACGNSGNKPPAEHADDDGGPAHNDTKPKQTDGGGNAPAIEAEVGALDEAAVKAAFDQAMPSIEKCLKDAQSELPFIEGEMEVLVRVSGDGTTAWAFPLKATFGHRATEQCVVSAISAQQWPSPQGGREGQTTQYLNIGTNERPAVAWSGEDLGRNSRTLMSKLKKCKSRHGADALSVTFYVDPGGKVMAAGSASSDENGREALQCAADAPKKMRFNSPGSYPAKLTITL